jgi:hypothetical protein
MASLLLLGGDGGVVAGQPALLLLLVMLVSEIRGRALVDWGLSDGTSRWGWWWQQWPFLTASQVW